MSVNDPIADMLTRIRNAGMAGQDSVQMPHSRMRQEIARILKSEGFVRDVAQDVQDGHKVLRISMKYGRNQRPVIHGLRRISKPGLRRYVPNTEIPRVVHGMGIAILSTSQGLLTDKQARKAKIGGEVLCYIW